MFWYSGALDDVGVAGLVDVGTPRGIEIVGWKFYNNVIANVQGLSAGHGDETHGRGHPWRARG